MKLSLFGFLAIHTVATTSGFTLAPACKTTVVSSTTTTTALSAGGGGLNCRPIGIGSAAPETRVTNVDLEAVVETSDEWISSRTGISSRHLLVQDEKLRDLGTRAAQNALTMAGVDAEDIDLVICATSSPDDMFGDATSIANNLGCTKVTMAFDLTAACSGFLFGIVTAGQFLSNENGGVKNVLVIGQDALSRWVDWDDRNSCILFGDGAGAMVLTATSGDDGDDSSSSCGVLGYSAHSNGAGYDDLKLK